MRRLRRSLEGDRKVWMFVDVRYRQWRVGVCLARPALSLSVCQCDLNVAHFAMPIELLYKWVVGV
jgi:hypothetical protein